MLRASTDKANLGTLASGAEVTYLPTVKAHNMQITFFSRLISIFCSHPLSTFHCIWDLLTDWLSGGLSLVWDRHLRLSGGLRLPSAPSTLHASSSWPRALELSAEVSLVWLRPMRRRLIVVEPVRRRRRLVEELRWRRQSWKLVVPTSPTPSLPILLGSVRPRSSPPSPSSHHLLDNSNKALPLLLTPEQLRELQLGR